MITIITISKINDFNFIACGDTAIYNLLRVIFWSILNTGFTTTAVLRSSSLKLSLYNAVIHILSSIDNSYLVRYYPAHGNWDRRSGQQKQRHLTAIRFEIERQVFTAGDKRCHKLQRFLLNVFYLISIHAYRDVFCIQF
jgi:hypothetical protein